MLTSLAELHHYTEPNDRQLLDQIEMRAAIRKAEQIERTVCNCMARAAETDALPTRPGMAELIALGADQMDAETASGDQGHVTERPNP